MRLLSKFDRTVKIVHDCGMMAKAEADLTIWLGSKDIASGEFVVAPDPKREQPFQEGVIIGYLLALDHVAFLLDNRLIELPKDKNNEPDQ